MKKQLLTTLTATSIAFFSATSYAEVTANAAVSSNYLWRGVTQTSDNAQVSGGIDYSHESGFYAGTWASNVDFGGDKPGYELDFYAGFAGEMGEFGYDVGYVYYAYPDAVDSIDFGELYGALSWNWLEGKVSYLSNAQSGASSEEDLLYVELNATFEVLNETELTFHIGNSMGDTVTEWFGEDDSYIDYGASIAKGGFTFGVAQTDLDADDDLKVYVGFAMDFEL
ncbi:TorF family putative porin [Pseudoalteromonas sp. SSM20]|uniref:TorF family putative porin n=1 Tax=Pseudoalteromonas sp. SSM20 TaxID=3139394 RepID=UPI003BA9E5A3